jgi:hypothetical protein
MHVIKWLLRAISEALYLVLQRRFPAKIAQSTIVDSWRSYI